MAKRRRRLAPERSFPAGDFLEAGVVTAVQGVAEGIKVRALSGNPAGLLRARTLRLVVKPAGMGPEGREYLVKAARRSGGCAVFALEGVDTVEAARELAGARVFVPRGDLPSLEEGEYFVADLVGCEVVESGAGLVGTVAEVVEGSAHDWLSIWLDGREKEALLPMISQFVREVNPEKRRIVVTPPEGWLDES